MHEFNIGSLVWAKLASYPYWPGRVTTVKDVKDRVVREALEPPLPNGELIWFFGTKNYAWVASNMVLSYDDGFEEKAKNKKAKQLKGFLQALKEAEEWKDNPEAKQEENLTKEQKKSSSPQEKRKTEDKKEEETKEKQGGEKSEESRKKEEEHRKRDEDRKKRDEEKRRKEKEERRRRESEGIRRKEERKEERKEDKRHSTGSREEEKDKTSKKRKASEEEEISSHKRAKIEPKKESNHNSKTETPPPPSFIVKEDRMDIFEGLPDQVEEITTQSLQKKSRLAVQTVVKAILTISRHPISKYHKFDVISHSEGRAEAKAVFSDVRANSKYEVHCILGAAHYLIDITCYIALLALMHEGESAITQDIHVSILAPIPQGSEVKVNARVSRIKPKAGLAFMDCDISWNGKVMATAKCVKSLLESDLPIKETKDEKLIQSPNQEKEKEKKENNIIMQTT